jgi:hypothetical protein
LETDDPRWLPAGTLAMLPPEKRETMMAAIQRQGCMRVRKLSPAEVWKAGSKGLQKLRPEYVPTLLGPDLAEVKRPDRHRCFVVDGQEYGGGDPIRFPAVGIRNVLGQDVVLDARAQYKVFANPFDLSTLFICDMDLRFIGTSMRQVGVSRMDLDGLHKAIGKASHDRAILDAPIQARHSAEAEERAAMIAHNDGVFATITGGVAPAAGAALVPSRRRISAADDAAMADISEAEPVGVAAPAGNIDELI